MKRRKAAADALAGVAALALLFYSVSDGNGGHVPVQCGLLAAGAVLVFEGLGDTLRQLLDRLDP